MLPPLFAYRSFIFDPEAVKAFADVGGDTVVAHPAHTLNSLGTPYSPYPPVWVGDGAYDFASLDRQFDDLLRIKPDFNIVCMVDLNTPPWWVRKRSNLLECRPDSFAELGRVASDPLWREQTAEYLRAFLEHTEARYGERIICYGLLCGHTTEWYDDSLGQESPSRIEAFREWLATRGVEGPRDIPPSSDRERSTHGFLRDPRTERRAIEYVRFCNAQVGDAILHFARVAREVVGRRAGLGVFYGYTLLVNKGKALAQGHVDLDRVLRSGLIDFIMSPPRYGWARIMGGTSGFLLPAGSARLHGVDLVYEIDHRTSTYNRRIAPHVVLDNPTAWPDAVSDIVGLRREFGISLVHNSSRWFFDMWGGFYAGAGVVEAIGRMRRLWERERANPGEPVAEIAVFVDERSWLYCNPWSEELGAHVRDLDGPLARTGMPFDYFSAADLDRVDLDRFKLVLFPNLFVVEDGLLDRLRAMVLGGGRTVLWFSRPGAIHNDVYDEVHVEQLTGLPFGADRIAARDMDGWRSLLAPEPILDVETLRRIATDAGVHQYLATGDPIWANSRLLLLHVKDPGPRTIRLPAAAAEVRELFTDRAIAENTDTFTVGLDGPETLLFGFRR